VISPGYNQVAPGEDRATPDPGDPSAPGVGASEAVIWRPPGGDVLHPAGKDETQLTRSTGPQRGR